MNIPAHFNSTSIINGDLNFTSDVRIDGKIIGNVIGDAKVIIGPEGFITGRLMARELILFGRIDGDICTWEETILHPGSSVTGALFTKVFTLVEGAILSAKVLTSEDPELYYNDHLEVDKTITQNNSVVQYEPAHSKESAEKPHYHTVKPEELIILDLKQVVNPSSEPAAENAMRKMFDQLNKELDPIENYGVESFFLDSTP